MKIAKLIVSTETIDDVVANMTFTVPPNQLTATFTSIKDELLEKIKKLNGGLKGTSKKYVLNGYQNMDLMEVNDPIAQECFTAFKTQKELEEKFSIVKDKKNK